MHNTEDEERRDANIRARNGGLDPRRQGTSPILDELQSGTHPDARDEGQRRQRCGVCVGGPMDGKQMISETNVLKVTENLRAQASLHPIDGPAAIPTIEHTYYWEGTNTWRHQGLSIPQMISHMAITYADAAARRDDGK